jgi:hypothetical protein
MTIKDSRNTCESMARQKESTNHKLQKELQKAKPNGESKVPQNSNDKKRQSNEEMQTKETQRK